VGYLRPERSFDSLESLIAAIQADIEQAKQFLDEEDKAKLQNAPFFTEKLSPSK